MHRITIIVFVILHSLCQGMNAQRSRFVGTWISQEDEQILIRDTTDQYSSSNYLVSKGYEMNLANALNHESKIALDWARGITSGQIAQNRRQVQKHGHQQNETIN